MSRVLIVDDSQTQMYVLKDLLQKNGFETLAASTGEEGIQKARDEHPDLILMDVVMPGLNGFQATRQITRDPETSSIPVIILTTKDQETDKMWGLRQGASDYLVKPPDERVLVQKVKALIAA
jgi:twitching motility two-component system response regulator PilH